MTRFLTTDAGLIRLPDGSYVLQPEMVEVPTITISGQAQSVGGRFLQAATVPTPPDGWEWRLYREGSPPVAFSDGPQNLDVGPVGEAPRPSTAYLLAEDGRVSAGQAINANFPSPQPLGIEGTIAITSAGFVGGPLTVTFPVVSFGTPLSGPTAAIRIYANQNDATPEDTETTIPTTYPAEWEGKWIQAYWSVGDIATDPTLREFASLRQFVSDDVTEPIEAGELTILRSVARGSGHSPIFTVASRISGEIQYRSGPTTEDGPWFNVEPNPGGAAGELRLADGFDPLYPDVNVAIFSAATPRPARNDRLRFRWRPSASQPWSVESGLYSVPNPVIIVVPGDETPDIVVSSRTALMSAVTNPAYKTIAIRKNSTPYSEEFVFPFISRAPGNEVKLIPENRNDPPTFTRGWSFPENSADQGCAGIIIDGFRFVSNQAETGPRNYTASNGNTCTIIAGDWPIATAISATDVNRFTVRNCFFDFWLLSINLGSDVFIGSPWRPSGFDPNSLYGQHTTAKNIVVEYCHFTRNGMDACRFFNNVNFIYRHNRYDNPRIDPARSSCDSTRHGDCIQTTIGRNAFGTFDAVIEDSYFKTLLGYHQVNYNGGERIARINGDTIASGGYANEPSGRGNKAIYGHKNMIIRRNYMEAAHINAIAVIGMHNCLIEGNLIRPIDPDYSGRPGVQLCGSNSGIIRNNCWWDNPSSNGGLRLAASGSGSTKGPVATLAEISHSGNVRGSLTAEPPGWAMPTTGPYAYNGGVPAP